MRLNFPHEIAALGDELEYAGPIPEAEEPPPPAPSETPEDISARIAGIAILAPAALMLIIALIALALAG